MKYFQGFQNCQKDNRRRIKDLDSTILIINTCSGSTSPYMLTWKQFRKFSVDTPMSANLHWRLIWPLSQLGGGLCCSCISVLVCTEFLLKQKHP